MGLLLTQAAVAGDPAGQLVQYGALGLLALLAILAVRVLFTQQTAAAARDQARADRLEQELRAQTAVVQDKVLPVLSSAIELIREMREQQGRRP